MGNARQGLSKINIGIFRGVYRFKPPNVAVTIA